MLNLAERIYDCFSNRDGFCRVSGKASSNIIPDLQPAEDYIKLVTNRFILNLLVYFICGEAEW